MYNKDQNMNNELFSKEWFNEQLELDELKINKPLTSYYINGEGERFNLEDKTSLDLIEMNITKLVLHNKNLEHLSCSNNTLTTLDLSKCPDLKVLYCSYNTLTTLDLSKCPNLKVLYCSYNNLTNLDLSKCPNLKDLYCYNNNLTNLDLSNCPNLKNLYCYNNKLTNLDLSNCPKLKFLNGKRYTPSINELKINNPSFFPTPEMVRELFIKTGDLELEKAENARNIIRNFPGWSDSPFEFKEWLNSLSKIELQKLYNDLQNIFK